MNSQESFQRTSSHSSLKERIKQRNIFTPHKIITRSMTRKGTFSTQADTNSIETKVKRRRRKTTTVRRKLDFEDNKVSARSTVLSREDIIQALKNMSVIYWSKGIENKSPKPINDLPQFPIRC